MGHKHSNCVFLAGSDCGGAARLLVELRRCMVEGWRCRLRLIAGKSWGGRYRVHIHTIENLFVLLLLSPTFQRIACTGAASELGILPSALRVVVDPRVVGGRPALLNGAQILLTKKFRCKVFCGLIHRLRHWMKVHPTSVPAVAFVTCLCGLSV